MKAIARSLVVILVALIAVPALAVSYTLATAVQLLAVVTGLYMGGTQHPLSSPPDEPGFITAYMQDADTNYIVPGTGLDPTKQVPVVYPAEFFPIFGSTTFDDSVSAGRGNLNSCIRNNPCIGNGPGGGPVPRGEGDTFVVFGYSQSAVVASLVKQDLIDNPAGAPDNTEFVLLSNPMRPNGGILGRGFEGMTIPIIGITFYGATPTNSTLNNNGTPNDTTDDIYEYPTVDVAAQYDLLGGDAPAVPWNLLAWANSAAAYYYLHGNVPSQSLGDAVYQGTTGDTDYYLLTSDILPLLMPLEQAGVPKSILLVANAPLKVLVEAGYYREPGPGENVPFQLLPEKDPITLAVNLVKSIPVGIDDGLDEAGVGRALGTEPAGPYGVGGPELPDPNENLTMSAASEGSPAPELKIAPEPPEAPVQPRPSGTEKIDSHLKLPVLDNNLGVRGNVHPAGALPEGTKPDPFGQLRESLNFDPPKPPSGLRSDGDGPLKKIVDSITKPLRPKKDEAEAADKAA